MRPAPATLPPEDANVVFVAMLTPSQAVDQFLGDLASKSRSRKDRSAASYRRVLYKFVDSLDDHTDITEVTANHVRSFFAGYGHLHVNTRATYDAYLRSFFDWLYRGKRIRRNPMDDIPKPRRVDPMDLDVTTVDKTDVPKLLAAADQMGWPEIMAVRVALYTGARRSALSSIRLSDYNQTRGTLKFYEKGGKAIEKPIAHELRKYIDAAIALHVYKTPDDYLIPSDGRRPKDAKGERDDRVIWRLVKKVADKAGVDAHVHALRAAFATFYLESHTGDLEGLREQMGHSSLEVTKVYLRKLDRQVAMERVRDLSWESVVVPAVNANVVGFPQSAGIPLSSSGLVGAGGFEPPSSDSLGAERTGRQPSRAQAEKHARSGFPSTRGGPQ